MAEKSKYIVLEASIADTHEWLDADKKPFNVYEIRVARGKFQWTVYHRFSEFDELRRKLSKAYPNVTNWPIFPGKKLFGKTAAKVVDERKAQLTKWIVEILKRSPINKDLALQSFLQADPDAVHPYISMLKNGDAKDKKDAIDSLENLSVVKEKRTEMVKQGAFKLVLSYSTKEPLPVQRVCLRIVNNMLPGVSAAESENHPIITCGGVKLLVQFSKQKDPELSTLALVIIANVVRANGDFQTRIIKELSFAPYIALVRAAISSNSNSKTIQALQCLVFLSEHSDINRVLLCKTENMKMLVDMCSGDVAIDVLCDVVRLLGVLSMDHDGKRAMIDQGGLVVLHKLSSKLAADLQTAVSIAVGNFCISLSKNMVYEVSDMLLDTLVPLLSARTLDGYRHAMRALACVSEFVGTVGSILAKKILDLVWAGHSKYGGNEDVDRFTAKVVANVCYLASARAEAIGLVGISHIKTLCTSHFPEAKAWALKAVLYLVSTPGDEAKLLWPDELFLKSKFKDLDVNVREDIRLLSAYIMWALHEFDRERVSMVWEQVISRLGRLSASTELSDHRDAIRVFQVVFDICEHASVLETGVSQENCPPQGSYAPLDQAHIASTGTGAYSIVARQNSQAISSLVSLIQSNDLGVGRAACRLLSRIAVALPYTKQVMDAQGLVKICVQGIRNTTSVRTQLVYLQMLNCMTDDDKIKSSFLEEGRVLLKKAGDKLRVAEAGSIAPILDLLVQSAGSAETIKEVKVFLTNFGIDSDNPMAVDQLYRGRYRLGAMIRRLATSVTRVGLDTQTNEKVWLKFVNDNTQFINEIKLMNQLGSNYVLRLVEQYTAEDVKGAEEEGGLSSPSATQLMRYNCIVTEAPDMTLAQYLKRVNLTPAGRTSLMNRLCECVGFLHHQKLVHGFLTPTTIAYVGDTMKFIGLDTVRKAGEELGIKFSLRYCSPEMAVAVRKNDTLMAQTSIDMYSLGCIIYEMYQGDALFEDHSDVLKMLGAKGPLDLPLETVLDRQIQKILLRILLKEPSERATIVDVQEILDTAATAPKTGPVSPKVKPQSDVARTLLGDEAENVGQSPSRQKEAPKATIASDDEEEEEEEESEEEDEPVAVSSHAPAAQATPQKAVPAAEESEEEEEESEEGSDDDMMGEDDDL